MTASFTVNVFLEGITFIFAYASAVVVDVIFKSATEWIIPLDVKKSYSLRFTDYRLLSLKITTFSIL